MSKAKKSAVEAHRHVLVLVVFALVLATLAGRAIQLQVFNRDFLQDQAKKRQLREVKLAAHRGMILARDGEPLAISTPVETIWARPGELAAAHEQHARLAKLLGIGTDRLRRMLARRSGSHFVYLKRHVTPELAAKVMALDIPGVDRQREYRRYYPMGEVAAHVVGFTNVDDQGQEGIELAYDNWLRGKPGAKRVLKDGWHHVVKDVEEIRAPSPGKNLQLTLDRRIQYLAYRELKAAVQKNRARSASAVVLDARNGDVLALVNQPAYNPNDRRQLKANVIRNRAVTDVFEPGSTIKPFTVAAALESGRYQPDTVIDTTPGFYKVGADLVRDVHNYGVLDVAGVIRKSSNVGASKIVLSLPPDQFWTVLHGVGFGTPTESGFPGEVGGLLSGFERWRPFELATLSFGYGLSVTTLQLAQAYATLATDGLRVPSRFVVNDDQTGPKERVLSRRTVREVRQMMEAVVGPEGTGRLAAVSGYRVAGKTGTVHKSTAGGYAEHRYVSLFAGMAPASDPRFVVVVVVDEPRGESHFGGQVAGPVFSHIMSGSLRLMDVPPDNLPLIHTRADHTEEPA